MFSVTIRNAKIQMMWNIYYMIPILCFNKKTKKVVALSAWFLNLSTLRKLLLQDIFQDEYNFHYIIKNMDAQA